MPAYVINDMEVTDPDLLEKYKALSPSTVSQYNGRFVVRGGSSEAIEGTWSPKSLVILEFPSVNQAKVGRSAQLHQSDGSDHLGRNPGSVAVAQG